LHTSAAETAALVCAAVEWAVDDDPGFWESVEVFAPEHAVSSRATAKGSRANLSFVTARPYKLSAGSLALSKIPDN
jgi:hypothetical protein